MVRASEMGCCDFGCFTSIANVDHHVMHRKSSTINKKKYYSMSFLAIDPTNLIIVDNYASYNIRVF